MSVALAFNAPNSREEPFLLPEADPPPLENGDRLARAEFHRRYEAMPNLKKAELIEGIVHMPSPVKLKHSQPHAHLVAWLATYSAEMSQTTIGDNGTLLLDFDNEPQPDAFLLIHPEAGGQSRINEDDFVEGAPELVVEIASSSASVDLNVKKHVYRRNGVREYLVWVTREARIEWWQLQDGEFVSLPVENNSLIKSAVFPGLWLEAQALLRGDLATVLAKLKEGLATAEALEFRQRLGK